MRKWLDFLTLIIVMIGALNWGLVGLFKVDVVAKIFGKMSAPTRAVYVLVGLSALLHVASRDYYLPFLGAAVYPCGSLTPKTPKGATVTVGVTVKPNANVIFWAAEPGNTSDKQATVAENPWVAYDEYANAGVARADASGRAVLSVRTPTAYRIPPFGKTLETHVHYRVCEKSGMLGPVKTVYV
jgi:uncharacterized membrane protein YuzA (DUF378 family)